MDNYKKNISKYLNNLTFQNKIIFIVLSCEHILPNYLFYKNKSNIELLDEIIVYFYQCINNDKYDVDLAQEFYDDLENLTPDLNEDENELASYAFDACVLFGEALLYIIKKDFSHLENASTILFDTIDMFIQEKEGFDGDTKDIETKIYLDAYMQQEIKRQISILEQLTSLPISSDFIRKIRVFSNSSVLCNLNLL